MAKIKWKKDGWNAFQEADPDKHILEINCRTEAGKVVEVRIRHNDGEEKLANVTVNGEAALPMDTKEFQKSFDKGELDMK